MQSDVHLLATKLSEGLARAQQLHTAVHAGLQAQKAAEAAPAGGLTADEYWPRVYSRFAEGLWKQVIEAQTAKGQNVEKQCVLIFTSL